MIIEIGHFTLSGVLESYIAAVILAMTVAITRSGRVRSWLFRAGIGKLADLCNPWFFWRWCVVISFFVAIAFAIVNRVTTWGQPDYNPYLHPSARAELASATIFMMLMLIRVWLCFKNECMPLWYYLAGTFSLGAFILWICFLSWPFTGNDTDLFGAQPTPWFRLTGYAAALAIGCFAWPSMRFLGNKISELF